MTPPEAVLFDNDGLLLDTEAVWTRGEQRLFEARGKEFTLDHKRSLVGSSEKVAAAKLVRFLDEPGSEKTIMEELNELVLEELESGVDAMVGGRELLAELNRRGIPVALISNSPSSRAGKSAPRSTRAKARSTGRSSSTPCATPSAATGSAAPRRWTSICRNGSARSMSMRTGRRNSR